MQIHEIQREHVNKTQRQVGRGGSRGKTSGRGHKGQKARAGHSIRPELRMQMKRIPKLRGRGNNKLVSIVRKPITVNIDTLAVVAQDGDDISPAYLLDRGLIKTRSGSLPEVKILGRGEISVKCSVNGCIVSESARKKIEKAGGTVNDAQDS